MPPMHGKTRWEIIMKGAKFAIEHQSMMAAYCEYIRDYAPTYLNVIRGTSGRIIQMYNESCIIPQCIALIEFNEHFFNNEYLWSKGGIFPGFRASENSFILILLPI